MEWWGENTGKASLPKSSWREHGKLETAAGTKLKREKGEGLNSIKTVNKGSTKAATLQLDTWRCSGGKSKSPGTEGSERFSGHTGKSSSTAGRTFGRDC